MPSLRLLLCTLTLLSLANVARADIVDTLTFGEESSEKSHQLAADKSETFQGGLGEPARKLLPGGAEPWQGGTASFVLKVNPKEQNYFTIRLWGSDVNEDRLILFAEGLQIGYRHLGDVETLDLGSEEPACNGRFFYRTSPLPLEMTKGKTELHLEIRSTGRIWNYGANFADFQRAMTQPTRGFYRGYTHTDGWFVPPPEEKQGEAPANPPVRATPGPEVLEQLRTHVGNSLKGLLVSKRPVSQMQAHFLAKAYHVKWTPAYHDPRAVEQVVRSVDALRAAWKLDEKAMTEDRSTPNPGWFAAGPAAEAVQLLAGPLRPALDQAGTEGETRRAQWLDLFIASREWLRQHRRLYTNQTMIVDLNIYRSHRAVRALDPAKALPEEVALRYLHEAVGLEPWLGSETPQGPEKRAGEHYYQLTAKGLTKELGYVGNYGEVLDWVTQLYDATRREPGGAGDARIKEQMVKIAHARAPFRYPALDAEGHRAMRRETVIGWRDTEYPGQVAYGEPARRDGSPFFSVAACLDQESVGIAQQMLADNQYYYEIAAMLKDRGPLNTLGMLGTPEEYALLQALPPSPLRLPMTSGQPDFVFTDEEDGVVALKHGHEILYASLYWRAAEGINRLARVHFITPTMERIAVTREEVKFADSGKTWARPDWVNALYPHGGIKYPGNMHSALTGEKLPVATPPEGSIDFTVGVGSPYRGKASWYELRYGDFLIGMNMTRDQECSLTVPSEASGAVELVSGNPAKPGAVLKVPARSTAILWIPEAPR